MNAPPDIHELRTPRLLLRQWRAADLAGFASLNADPEVMRYFPALRSQSESDAMANACRDLIAGRGWGLWAAQELDSGAFTGFIGLHIPAATLPCSPCVEVGWRLAQAYWGKGLATEGAQAAIQFGFEQLGLAEIVSFTSIHNFSSEAVMRRLGMQRDRLTFAHPALAPDHWLSEHCLYRIRNQCKTRH